MVGFLFLRRSQFYLILIWISHQTVIEVTVKFATGSNEPVILPVSLTMQEMFVLCCITTMKYWRWELIQWLICTAGLKYHCQHQTMMISTWMLPDEIKNLWDYLNKSLANLFFLCCATTATGTHSEGFLTPFRVGNIILQCINEDDM